MTTTIRNEHRRSRRTRRGKAGIGCSTAHPSTEQQRARARKLLATEIAFIPNASFRHGEAEAALAPTTSTSDSPPAATTGPRAGLVRLPPHLARLCTAPLLTAAQERDLFRRMNYLKYKANVLRATLDPDEPDVEALAKAEGLLVEAQSVRDQIVRANMRLVMAVVKKFVTARNSFDEMLSDGLLTLLKAVDKFDYARGFRFSTYAYRAISSNTCRSLAERARKESLCVQFADAPFDIEDNSESSLPAERSWKSLRATIAGLLGQLDPRERFIVCERFALGSQSQPRTLQSLADELGVSKERIRQLEQRAVSTLHGIVVKMRLDELLEPTDVSGHRASPGDCEWRSR